MRSLISLTSWIYNIFLQNAFCIRHLQNTRKKHKNDEKSDDKAQKNKQNIWYKKLSEPESDNLSKVMRWTTYILEITY